MLMDSYITQKSTAKRLNTFCRYTHEFPEKGFTVVELMATIVIAGILATIAVPSLRNMTLSNRMTTQANDFVTAMMLARSEAIKRHTTIDVLATNGSDTNNEWGKGWHVDTAGGSTLRKFQALDNSAALNSNSDNVKFQYLASGRASPVDTLYLCDDRKGESGRKITVAATGHVNVTKFTCP